MSAQLLAAEPGARLHLVEREAYRGVRLAVIPGHPFAHLVAELGHDVQVVQRPGTVARADQEHAGRADDEERDPTTVDAHVALNEPEPVGKRGELVRQCEPRPRPAGDPCLARERAERASRAAAGPARAPAPPRPARKVRTPDAFEVWRRRRCAHGRSRPWSLAVSLGARAHARVPAHESADDDAGEDKQDGETEDHVDRRIGAGDRFGGDEHLDARLLLLDRVLGEAHVFAPGGGAVAHS